MRKIKKKLPSSYNKLYPILLFIATLFMGLGYASLNPANLTINFLAQAIPQNGVFISDSIFNSSDEGNFKIVSTNSTLLNSSVVLSSDNPESFVSYKIVIYNNTDHDYYYNGVLCDTSDLEFYSNPSINYEVSGINVNDVLYSKSSATITILFKYASGVVPSVDNNKLNSFINFDFRPVSGLVNNIVSTISSNTGVFENVDSILNYTLSITNNNGIPVSYDVICDSTDAINCTGGVRGVVIPAYGTSNVSIDLRTVNGYVYRGDIHSIDVILKLVSPTEVEVNTYQIAVDSYGSTLNEIITLYNPITTTPSFSENVTTKDSSGLFTTSDGSTNYFRGVVENNYLEFAGNMWRILRVNDDGTARIILNSPIGTTSTYDYSNSVDNTNFDGSVAESELTSWYSSNLLSYNDYINQNALFLHDRSDSDSNGIYDSWSRIFGNGPLIDINSSNTQYLYGISSNSLGNGLLTYPVGLITSDEIVMAGAIPMSDANASSSGSVGYNANSDFFLANDVPPGVGIWTMSPYSSTAVIVFKSQVGLFKETPYSARLLKPVIELKSGLKFVGDGTIGNAYKIEE